MKDSVTPTAVSDQDEAPTSYAELTILLQPDARWQSKIKKIFVRLQHPSRKRSP
jgi:hypothetical protein